MGRHRSPRTPTRRRPIPQLLSPPSTSKLSGSKQWGSAPFGTPDSFSTPTKVENESSIYTPPQSTKFPSFTSTHIQTPRVAWSEDESDEVPGTPCPHSRIRIKWCSSSDLRTHQLPVSPEIDDDNVSSEHDVSTEDDVRSEDCVTSEDGGASEDDVAYEDVAVFEDDVSSKDDVQDAVATNLGYDGLEDDEDLKHDIVMKVKKSGSVDEKYHLGIKQEENTSATDISNKRTCNLVDAYTHSHAQFKTENSTDMSVKKERFSDNEKEECVEEFSPEVASLKRKRAQTLRIEEILEFGEEALNCRNETGLPAWYKSKLVESMRKKYGRNQIQKKTPGYLPVKTECKYSDTKDPFTNPFYQPVHALGLGISYPSSLKQDYDGGFVTQEYGDQHEEFKETVKEEPYAFHTPPDFIRREAKLKQNITCTTPNQLKAEDPEEEVEKWAVKAVEYRHRSKRLRSQPHLSSSTIKDEPDSFLLSPSPFAKHESKYQPLYNQRDNSRHLRERSSTPSIILNRAGGNKVIFRGKLTLCDVQTSLPAPPKTTSLRGWTPNSSRKASFTSEFTPRELLVKKLCGSAAGDPDSIDLVQGSEPGDQLTSSNLESNNNIAPLLFSHYMGTTTPESYNSYKYLKGPYNPRLLALDAACDALEAKMRVPPKTTTGAASEASSETLCLGDGEGGSSWVGFKDSDDGKKWGFDYVWGNVEEIDGEGAYLDTVDEGEECLRVESPCPSCDS
jgi:hypothetical protein